MPSAAALDEFLKDHGVKHFKAVELAASGLVPRKLWSNILPTVHYADLLRGVFGRTGVRSGHRGPAHNARVGGTPSSLHLSFNALDLAPEDGSPGQWKDFFFDTGLSQVGGLGLYDDFVHIDTRFLVFGRTPAYWNLETS